MVACFGFVNWIEPQTTDKNLAFVARIISPRSYPIFHGL